MASGSAFFLESSTGSEGENRYIYALRKDEDGTLWLARADIKSSTDEFTFSNGELPEDLETFTIPGKDYFENRDPTTKELEYDRVDVRYEQWRYDNKFNTYFINENGEFIIATGVDRPINQDGAFSTIPPTAFTTAFEYTIAGTTSALNLREELFKNGWNGISPVVVTNDGVLVSGNSNPALSITGAWPGGITIINNNKIYGANGFTTVAGQLIDPTDAIYVTTACDIINNGDINGGFALWSGGTDGYAIRGISNVTLTDNGTIGSTI